jgi:hypothetical protein
MKGILSADFNFVQILKTRINVLVMTSNLNELSVELSLESSYRKVGRPLRRLNI